ncbi:MAG: exo-alpha-sialidase [Phycisphaeraceae bacterium]|nr:exo-alpha-sialidase [Phycisphaeraceae bacterium]
MTDRYRLIALLSLVALLAGHALSIRAQTSPAISRWARQLAQEYAVLYRCSDLDAPDNPDHYICVGSPDIIRLPSGKLLASMELWLQTPSSGIEGGIDYPDHCKVMQSSDDGATWTQISTNPITWGSFFAIGDDLYLMGADPKSRMVTIVGSKDEGKTWSQPTVLSADGHYGCAAGSVVIHDGKVYRSYGGRVDGNDYPQYHKDHVGVQFLFVGDTSQDLLDAASWHRSKPGFGPQAHEVAALFQNPIQDLDAQVSCMEGNAILAPDGHIDVLTRTQIDGQLIAGLTARFSLDPASENLDFQFDSLHAMMGGQNKFKVIFDETSGLYWACVSAVPENDLDVEPWHEQHLYKGSAGNVRRMLMLTYSLDSRNWFEAGCIAMSRNPLESFHYASLTPSGDDMLVLARTSLGGKPYNNHDSNLITLHRVKNFRALALDLRSDVNTSAAAE